MELLLRTLTIASTLCAARAVAVPTMVVDGMSQHLHPGDMALLTCNVHHLGDLTVVWRRASPGGTDQRSEVLTAGHSRVSSDPRLQLEHNADIVSGDQQGPGGEIYVLVIHNVTVWDAGTYVCEINSQPPVRGFFQLAVISTSLEAPLPQPDTSARPEANHDFGRCCRHRNVTSHCLQLCSLQGLLGGGGLADFDRCQADFPNIYHCMADGRDHLPCCVDQGVPVRCSHLCRGEYFLQKNSLRDYFSCRDVTEVIVNCVSRGIETLPAKPGRLEVTPRSLTALRVSWVPGLGHVTAPGADWFTVNVTLQRSFDSDKMALLPSNGTEVAMLPIDTGSGKTQLFNVSSSRRSLAVSGLHPLTMYEVSVAAHNAAGASLASDRVRAVTWVPETRSGRAQPPALPDVRLCCREGGVKEPRCLRNLCDPARAADTDYTDLIVCSPWTRTTLSCMTDGRDHSDCCRARGLPPLCVQMCAGNVQQIDYRYFPCLDYMSSYASCLMQGYGVVPSAPLRPRVALDDAEFAVLRWSPPEVLTETVLSYTVHVRQLHSENTSYTASEDVHSPYLLYRLLPEQEYEFYVTAINQHGGGAESSRVVFRTLPRSVPEAVAFAESYPDDLFACCRRAGINPACEPLCNATVQENLTHELGDICASEWHKVTRCGAAGRDHTPCCRRRGVPDPCLPDCRGQGLTPDPCRAHYGSVRTCFAEGRGELPPPVAGLRLADVTEDSVTLVWETDDATEHYKVRYGLLNGSGGVGSTLITLNQVMNVSAGVAQLTNLTSGQRYAFTVLAVNGHGSSLPASVIVVNLNSSADLGAAQGTVSAPHSLSASEVTLTGMTLTWAPPVIAPHDARITYRLYYRAPNSTAFETINTVGLSHRLEYLQPGTPYTAYVTAFGTQGESGPSEILKTWTLSTVAAYVQLPTVQPSEVTEGGSMTVLCVAVGSPLPTVRLYISGVLMNQNRTRHLVTSVSNVTRAMEQVTCVVDSGYGASMDATRYIPIRRRPIVTVQTSEPVSSEGGTVVLSCAVDAHPEPTLTWSGPRAQPITDEDANYNATQERGAQEGFYMMELKIDRVAAEDFGRYSCHAENVLGADSRDITLTKRQEPPRLYELGVAECCRKLNVSQQCLGACAESDVNLEAVLATAGCVSEFSKLMTCAADGSDHSACCSARSVPDHCLSWCEGRPTTEHPDCAVRYATDVIGCFEKGKVVIPGPPTNVRVERINTTDVMVRWNPPSRNADMVAIYRLTWRQLQHRSSAHVDTRRTQHSISGLEPGASYQLTVTAANRNGNSLEAGLEFKAAAGPITAQSTDEGSLSSGAVLALALVLAVLMLVLVLGGTWLVRRRWLNASVGRHMSFDNPTYLRETGRDGVQEFPEAALTARSAGSSDGSAPIGLQHTSTCDGWQEAALHTPAARLYDGMNGL